MTFEEIVFYFAAGVGILSVTWVLFLVMVILASHPAILVTMVTIAAIAIGVGYVACEVIGG